MNRRPNNSNGGLLFNYGVHNWPVSSQTQSVGISGRLTPTEIVVLQAISMTKTRPLPEDNIAILAYGSLLTDPGEVIKPHLLGAIEQITPFGVEYARSSRSRGGAPTLVKYENAEPVSGRLLVLDQAESAVEEVKRWLWEREGRPQWSAIK